MRINGMTTIRKFHQCINTRGFEGYNNIYTRINSVTAIYYNNLLANNEGLLKDAITINVRNFSKKRLSRMAGSGRIKRRGEDGFNYMEVLKRQKESSTNDAPTIAEQLGWTPIVVMLFAPIIAWGALYLTRPQSVRQQMLASIGMNNGQSVDATTTKTE